MYFCRYYKKLYTISISLFSTRDFTLEYHEIMKYRSTQKKYLENNKILTFRVWQKQPDQIHTCQIHLYHNKNEHSIDIFCQHTGSSSSYRVTCSRSSLRVTPRIRSDSSPGTAPLAQPLLSGNRLPVETQTVHVPRSVQDPYQ